MKEEQKRKLYDNSSRRAKYGQKVKVSRKNRPNGGDTGRGRAINSVSVSMHPDAVKRRARLPVYLSFKPTTK